ncbi:MAG TPA: transposase [Candidatus Sulfotelmatobacter sp.]|nr:transposase [Candidatus Sulfotelmatobacter sp.]
MIRYSLNHLQFLEDQLAELDRDIAEQIRSAGLEQQWQLIQSVPGLQDRSAAAVLAETGGDMRQFPTAGDLSSWAGVCPGNNKSAGKSKSSRTTGGNPWLRGALTECAWAAAAKKNCFLRDRFWRIAGKKNQPGAKPRAVLAVAHTLLLLVYDVLRTGRPYQERSAAPLTDVQKQRMIRHHVRRLGKLGISIPRLVPSSTSDKSATRKCRPRKQESNTSDAPA